MKETITPTEETSPTTPWGEKIAMKLPKVLVPALRYMYLTARLIIPACIYSIRLLSNPRLIKFVIPWATSNLMPDRSPLKDEAPWVTFEAKEWLKEFLGREMTIFEYGSGGSTTFFSKRVSTTISVEHDHAWYRHVSETLKEKNISNCNCLLLEPQPGLDGTSNFADPESFASREYANMNFEAYVKSIDSFPDESFDLVFIDGRARPSCILRAVTKIRPGGFLMLDNSDRPYYLRGKELLVNWQRTDFFGPWPYGRYFWQTSIWKKPLDLSKQKRNRPGVG